MPSVFKLERPKPAMEFQVKDYEISVWTTSEGYLDRVVWTDGWRSKYWSGMPYVLKAQVAARKRLAEIEAEAIFLRQVLEIPVKPEENKEL